MASKYRTSVIAAVVFLFSEIFLAFSVSPAHLQSLYEDEKQNRNGYYAHEGYTQSPFWYMTPLGCRVTVLELKAGEQNPWLLDYQERTKKYPCNFVGYHLYGPGAWLTILSVILFILNFFELRIRTSDPTTSAERYVEKQKKYLIAYLSALFGTVALQALAIGLFVLSIMAWGESSELNREAGYAIYVALGFPPITYVVLATYGWGLHKFNLKKFTFLGILALVPSMIAFGVFVHSLLMP